ncbi:hypothetical protein ACVIHI_004945 [Bradyrhizobium sp. USDA 4524]|uniref:hypothetical protein n=1 Tax=unclassified Bradyrhizobium TaxID=2631580 RepID=UPI00209D1CEE|nr:MULTISPECIES: hypothetical protein [unclassified Bradyrhizobium]MCP1842137.1 hypothetical protein [Bradyrhizobium sp. USDA 4538]MCP1902701.1 hypothetical protein [Bradyrhizobium sp. USDA 4537]MCP1991642.1 hypothetical protein [Bradyrhizobium sp. USDA 4539]
MIVVGGTYEETCNWPASWNIMGSGLRAAMTVSGVSPGSELYTCADPAAEPDLRLTAAGGGIGLTIRPRRGPISFYYEHHLTSPPDLQAEDWEPREEPVWTITGETALAFPLKEQKILLNAERAVIEISPSDPEIERGKIGALALIAAEDELPGLTSTTKNVRVGAERWLNEYNAELIIIRRPAGGAFLIDRQYSCDVPAYEANRWHKIGAGNVFCAMFAHYWGERRMEPQRAAELASRSATYYASERVIPMVGEDVLPPMDTFDSAVECKIFIASPRKSMAREWLLNQAIDGLRDLGVQTVSKYDLERIERSNANSLLDDCDAVLVLAEGSDISSVFAVGVAKVRSLPIVILSEESREATPEWPGANCEIVHDFASAVYRAMVAGRKWKSRKMAAV